MSTLERLKELSANFQDEMSGISMAEFREIMESYLPKLLAVVEAGDELARSTNWQAKQNALQRYLTARAELDEASK